MKLKPHTFAVAIALTAASTLSLAQLRAPRGANDVSTYQRNHQAPTAPTASIDSSSGALREDMDGTVVSTEDAVQLCDTLSRRAQRDDCVAQVSRDEASMPTRSDSGMSSGSSMERGTATDGMMRRHPRR